MDLLKESMSLVFGQKGADTSIQKLINPAILQRMCVASYALNKGKTPEADIEGWKLVGSSLTVLCYSKYGVYVVAVRGTASAEDWQTNATIALNSLVDTQRAQTMIQQVEKWKQEHPNETQWFATGHSLGGALCDVLLRLKLVREAFTFNPAVQPQDFNGKLPNRRVYARGDPLYQLMGRFTVGAVLLPAKDFLTELRYRVVGENVYDYLSEHALSSFKDAPESLLVGNAKKQPKKPKQPKPRLPVPRGPNLQLIQDLFKKLEAQREPDREMDDLTREMDQIIPKDRTPAPPPPSPPSEGSGKRRKRGGVRARPIRAATWTEVFTLISTLVAGMTGVMGSVVAQLHDPRADAFLWTFTASSLAALFGGTRAYWQAQRQEALDNILNPPEAPPPEVEGEVMVQNPMQPRPEPEGPRFPAFAIPPPNPPTREFPEGQETGLMSDIPIDAILGVLNGDEGTDRVYLASEIVELYRSGNFRNPFTRAPITNVTWYRARRREDVQEVTIPMAPPEGSARPATFQYSREGLTANQKAAERAAYYRKHPAENPKKKVVEVVEKPKKQPAPKKAQIIKELKQEPKQEPKELTLAERAKLTRAKVTLRKGIIRKLLRKSAELRLWIALYKKGSYYNSDELSKKEDEAYKNGRGVFTKDEWDRASEQTYNISVLGKWKDYLPQSAYDRISKQVAAIKEKLEAKYKK